jgi:GNAT superfamily N-acetyltransferase
VGGVTETPVEAATVEHRRRVVETVVSAFHADPAFRWFFRDPAAFDRHATAFAGYLFDGRVDAGTVWVADGGSAVSMWDGPGGWTDAPLDLPRDVRDRLDHYGRIVHRLLPATDHWYLGVLATHPEHSGRRLGRAVMTPGVRRAAAAGLPAYLETANPVNVGIYGRSGWTVATETAVDDLPVWVMCR